VIILVVMNVEERMVLLKSSLIISIVLVGIIILMLLFLFSKVSPYVTWSFIEPIFAIILYILFMLVICEVLLLLLDTLIKH